MHRCFCCFQARSEIWHRQCDDTWSCGSSSLILCRLSLIFSQNCFSFSALASWCGSWLSPRSRSFWFKWLFRFHWARWRTFAQKCDPIWAWLVVAATLLDRKSYLIWTPALALMRRFASILIKRMVIRCGQIWRNLSRSAVTFLSESVQVVSHKSLRNLLFDRGLWVFQKQCRDRSLNSWRLASLVEVMRRRFRVKTVRLFHKVLLWKVWSTFGDRIFETDPTLSSISIDQIRLLLVHVK